MKKVLFVALALVVAGLTYAFIPKNDHDKAAAIEANHESAIKWMTWDEAIEANKKDQKVIFIDFYTDWCGWCKRMDKTTFADHDIADYINKNFYPVKFNAEQKETILFDGNEFKWQKGGRNGYHDLAFSLLDGRLGYPSYVYLSPKYERILISPGFKPVPDLQKELKFVNEGHYSSTSWEEYKKLN